MTDGNGGLQFRHGTTTHPSSHRSRRQGRMDSVADDEGTSQASPLSSGATTFFFSFSISFFPFFFVANCATSYWHDGRARMYRGGRGIYLCHQGRGKGGADGLEHGQPAPGAGAGAVQLLRDVGVLCRGRRPRERRRLHRLGLGLLRGRRAWPGSRDGDPGWREVGRWWPDGDGGVLVGADGGGEGGPWQRRREEVRGDGAPLHVVGTDAGPAAVWRCHLHGRKRFRADIMWCHFSKRCTHAHSWMQWAVSSDPHSVFRLINDTVPSENGNSAPFWAARKNILKL